MIINGTDCMEHQCGSCGVWYALPRVIYETAYREGGFWSCPNGHRRGWEKGQTPKDIEKLRQERDRLRQRVAERDDEISGLEKSVSAHKGQITKMRKRAAAGVCPCCNRNFVNLARHMKSKHPDYGTAQLEVIEGAKA